MLAAVIFLVGVAAGPADAPQTKADYDVPVKIFAAIPDNLRPQPGKTWDSFVVGRVNPWLESNMKGKTLSDVTVAGDIEPIKPKKGKEVDPEAKYALSWIGKGTYKNQRLAISIGAIFPADQEEVIAKLKAGEKVKIIGEISEVRVLPAYPTLQIVLKNAKIKKP